MKILTQPQVKDLSQNFINILNILKPEVDTKDYQETIDVGYSNFGHMLELSQKVLNAIK